MLLGIAFLHDFQHLTSILGDRGFATEQLDCPCGARDSDTDIGELVWRQARTRWFTHFRLDTIGKLCIHVGVARHETHAIPIDHGFLALFGVSLAL